MTNQATPKKKLTLSILMMGLVLMFTSCTPSQVRAWKKWHQQDPQAAMEFANGINGSAEASTGAERVDPPAPPDDPPDDPPADSSPGFSSANNGSMCTGALGLLQAYSPGWDSNRMAKIMYRESRCQPGAYNSSGASGLLQVLKSHCGWLASRVGSCNLFSPTYNVRAAAMLWRNGGYRHWTTA